MTTLDFSEIVLQQLITHHVGNKLRDEKFSLSTEVTTIEDDTKDFLLKYFLLPIKAEEFYAFTHPVKLELNDIYSVAESIFSNPSEFIPSSKGIAELLYEQSMHPKIKEGELNIAYFSNVVLDGEIIEAIGVFKSETGVPFLKMKNQKSKFLINHDYGFEIKGMDKGCIIFNTDKKNGYKILIIDNANKSIEAQYWKDDFLKVRPVRNEFHQTTQFLGIAKTFVTKQLSDEFPVSKADKIDLLNRSVEYFKTHESFEKDEFEKNVFQNNGIIQSFRNFDTTYREDNNIELTDRFDISPQAVKKQSRIFKSVLKLDKNFHIYIHGNRDLIEQGVDKDGRKFYKIYFENES
ncbi:MAG TPA: nucleoid-associated protein [Candidatus Cloacimonadota bacterium]|nr:nucleoid-associated protein [Candidatus Cloacimonadota bacterium]